MKKLIALCFLVGLFYGCLNNDEMTDSMLSTENEMEENSPNSSIAYSGIFMSGAHTTSGNASVNLNKTELNFESFKTDNGPKLLVYLSTDVNATEFVDLGDLKGIEGDFTYIIPENTDIEKYKIVNIWCVDFLVSFGTAELKMP